MKPGHQDVAATLHELFGLRLLARMPATAARRRRQFPIYRRVPLDLDQRLPPQERLRGDLGSLGRSPESRLGRLDQAVPRAGARPPIPSRRSALHVCLVTQAGPLCPASRVPRAPVEATAWGAFLKLAQATFSSAPVDRYGHQRCPRSQPTSSPVVGMASADNRHPDRFDPDPPEPGHRRVPRVRYKCINLNSAGRNIALAQDNGAPLACGSAEFGFWSGAGDTI